MIGEWDILERILFGGEIVSFKVIVECFFVGDVPVELEVVVQLELVSAIDAVETSLIHCHFSLICALADVLCLHFTQQFEKTCLCVLPYHV